MSPSSGSTSGDGDGLGAALGAGGAGRSTRGVVVDGVMATSGELGAGATALLEAPELGTMSALGAAELSAVTISGSWMLYPNGALPAVIHTV